MYLWWCSNVYKRLQSFISRFFYSVFLGFFLGIDSNVQPGVGKFGYIWLVWSARGQGLWLQIFEKSQIPTPCPAPPPPQPYSLLSTGVTKTQTPKSQGLLRYYLHLAKDLLKVNSRASFQRDSVFRFENKALPNFPSLLRVTLIWRPRRPSHMLKNIFIAWYYALWMVKVLGNVFRGIICSFAVNYWSNLWRYWNQMFALFPAAMFVLLGGAQLNIRGTQRLSSVKHLFWDADVALNFL